MKWAFDSDVLHKNGMVTRHNNAEVVRRSGPIDSGLIARNPAGLAHAPKRRVASSPAARSRNESQITKFLEFARVHRLFVPLWFARAGRSGSVRDVTVASLVKGPHVLVEDEGRRRMTSFAPSMKGNPKVAWIPLVKKKDASYVLHSCPAAAMPASCPTVPIADTYAEMLLSLMPGPRPSFS